MAPELTINVTRNRSTWHKSALFQKQAKQIRQCDQEKSRVLKKIHDDFRNGDAQMRSKISRERWSRATCVIMLNIMYKQSRKRRDSLKEKYERASYRCITRAKIVAYLEDRGGDGDTVKTHKYRYSIENIQRQALRDAYFREDLIQNIMLNFSDISESETQFFVDDTHNFSSTILNFVDDIREFVARLHLFGLTPKDNYTTINYFKMAQSLAYWCKDNREVYLTFTNSTMMPRGFGKECIYPKLFEKHLKVALAGAHSFWKDADNTLKEMNKHTKAVQRQNVNMYSRWKRLVRLIILQDRADREATVKNKAEAHAHRELRATLVEKPERAFTLPGQSHKHGPVKWADEALDAGDKAKRVSTKAASLRAVQDAKKAKCKQKQLDLDAAIERARKLAIGDAIVEED